MTAPPKPAAADSSSSSKITLVLAGVCVVGAVGFASHSGAPAEIPEAAAVSTVSSPAPQSSVAFTPRSRSAPLSSSTGAPDFAPSRNADEERGLPAPEAATKVSVRPVSSSSVPEGSRASASSSRHGMARAGASASTSKKEGNLPHSSPLPAESRAAADAVRIAQSAATPSLAHAVTDEQVKQLAPQVPQETLDRVRDQFEQTAGVGQLDPSDPAYAPRWDAAERESANQMRSLYGWAAYAAMQRQAALAAAGEPGN